MKNIMLRAPELLACFSLSVLCLIGCSSGGSNNGSTGTGTGSSGGSTTPPVVTPTVTSVSPTKLAAGAAATTLTVTGTNFISTSALQVGGVVEPTTYVSTIQLTASIPASQLASGADLPVIVLNGDNTSASDPVVNLEVDNPAPAITSFTPATVAVGSASKMIAITGTGFVPTTTVQLNGNSRGVTYVSSTQVNLLLSAADQSVGQALSLSAVNPTPGGGTSAAASLPVNYPVPEIISFSPALAIAGTTTPTTITATGINFTAATTVSVGSTAHTATIISPTQLTFVLSVADQAAASNLSVTATNPTPGGGTSLARTLPVAAPTPTPVISSVSPSSLIVGSPDTQITVSGTNLFPASTTGFTSVSATVAQWNGTPLVTTGYGSIGANTEYIIATVPASLLAATGTATITVNSPSALNPLSNALTVSIGNPPVPTLTSISPNYGPINTATGITLTGTGFSNASTVSLNGTTLPTTYNNSTSLSVTVPAASLAIPGNDSFTVTTPAPGGGTSASQVFSAYIPLVSNSAIYNPVDGLYYASIPGSVPAPLGNSIVSVNPATGALGTPIFVGSEPDKLALTADGHYLWVGLDGSSAVRKVDLVAKTAGLQFSLPLVNGGIYQSPATAQALAALPGATDSVVVALSSSTLSSNVGLAIFDSGVARANTSSNTIYNNNLFAIQVDGTKSEIYAGGQNAYDVFTYNSNGLTSKTLDSITPASSSQPEMQLIPGKLITDFGQVFDPEAGALLGTLYVSGQTVAQGATFADSTLGKIFVADSSTGALYNGINQIQVFNLNDYTSFGSSIPVNVPAYYSSSYNSVLSSSLSRWGANGLAFHTPFGIYSLQSNSVVDLSSTTADLAVTLTTGGSTTTGGNTTFTAVITNNGPSAATDVVLNAQVPSTGTLVSAASTVGSCSTNSSVSCTLGSLANGSSATITLTVLQTAAGTSTASVQVSGSTPDSNTANNSASASATITGAAYSVAPVLSSITPAAIETGTTDTTLTVNGSGFISGSTVMVGSTTLTTTFVSSTQLAATVPAASLTSLGWSTVTVTTPAPGGGVSSPLPLTVYSVITLGANHILYDPYSRNIMASVGSGSSTVTGNSIAAINPATASVGTPVSIGSQPTNLALTSDGQILYTILSGNQSVARYNMLTGQPDFTYTVPTNSSFDGGIALRGIATQPGTENTIALDLAAFSGNAIFDFDPVNKTAAIRGQATGPYTGSCITFLDAADFLSFDIDTTGFSLDHYTVTTSGFQYYNYSQISESTLNHFGCFKLSGGLAFADGGGIANPVTEPATQVATLAGVSGGGFSNSDALAPDASLQQAFYPSIAASSNGNGPDGFTAFNLTTYQPTFTLPLNMAAIEGANSGYSQVDMIRWGQDGLAILTSTGHIYLLRGAAIVPGLLQSGAMVATLASSSSSTLTKGSGNVLLSLTGSNFAPGTAVTWNGSYRTTTIIDATHVTVAIPASDLAAATTASLVATNPGASASNTLSIHVQ